MKSTRSTTVAVVRQRTGLSALDFGKLIGKPLGTVKSLEAGRLKLSEGTAMVISEKTGVSMVWLLSCDVKTQPVDQFGNPWKKETFEDAEGRRSIFISHSRDSTQFVAKLCDRLRAILSNQETPAKGFMIATARTERFLNELQNEFGIASDVQSRIDNTKSLPLQPSLGNARRADGHKSS
jgi:hypothetical protein